MEIENSRKIGLINTSNSNAIYYKILYKFYLGLGLICINITVFAFAMNLIFGIHNLFIIIAEMLLPIVSFFLLKEGANESHKKYIESRRQSEILRWSVIFLKPKQGEMDSLSEEKYLKAVLDETNYRNIFDIQTPDHANDVILEQINYHNSRIYKNENKYKSLHLGIQIIIYIFLLLAVWKGLIELDHHHFIKFKTCNKIEWLKYINFVLIFLPSLFATLEAILFFQRYKKDIITSKIISSNLLKLSKNTSSDNFGVKLFSILINEHRDWYEDRRHLKIEPRI